MAPPGARVDEELLGQFLDYRADLRRQFCRNCIAFVVAFALVLLIRHAALWAGVGIAVWTIMLILEASAAFGTSENIESAGFLRWRSRQEWEAAANGDIRSLERLQNVQ